jgi:uncharacterized protein YpuA (DUF1002 family)
MKIKKTIGLFLIITLLATSFVYADSFKVISLGNDLNQQQREEMLEQFGVEENDVQIIVVTNQEERQYLEGIAPLSKIGNRAISCAYVEPQDEGSGLDVSTSNLTWATKEMIASALTTAGIKDAKVVASAPFSVSGTAALTGIMKGFEKATGQKLNMEAKDAANREMITTGELGEQIGQDNAVEFMNEVKKEVVQKKAKSPEDIRSIIEKVAKHYDIQLSEEQIQKIIDVMDKISKLDLNIKDISNQLKDISGKLSKVLSQGTEARSILDKILGLLENIIARIKNWI